MILKNEQAPEKLYITVMRPHESEAVIIQCGGKTIFLDTGGDKGSAKLISALKDIRQTKIEKFIITSHEEERVSGADELIGSFEIGEICLPETTDKASPLHKLAKSRILSSEAWMKTQLLRSVTLPYTLRLPTMKN